MERDSQTHAELLSELKAMRSANISDQVGMTMRTLLACLCVGFVAWCTRGTVSDLAGYTTTANISISLLSKVEFAATISICFGVGGVLYGFHQRQLRRRTLRHLHGRLESLERRLDPLRTSSQLTAIGTTNPEDKL